MSVDIHLSTRKGILVWLPQAYRLVCDEMVNIMAALPPSHGQATAKVGNEESNQRVNGEIGGDGSMSSIMSREHDLVLSYFLSSCQYWK